METAVSSGTAGNCGCGGGRNQDLPGDGICGGEKPGRTAGDRLQGLIPAGPWVGNTDLRNPGISSRAGSTHHFRGSQAIQSGVAEGPDHSGGSGIGTDEEQQGKKKRNQGISAGMAGKR